MTPSAPPSPGARPRARHAAAAACLVLAACAAEPVARDQPKIVRGRELAPQQIREECMRLVVGDRLDFEFSASAPVDFNIHYHEGKTVIAPLSRDGLLADSGIFVPGLAHDYCLMWEAGPAGALLDYRIRLRSRAP